MLFKILNKIRKRYREFKHNRWNAHSFIDNNIYIAVNPGLIKKKLKCMIYILLK